MRTVDLFAGCGGMSKGFETEGFELVMAAEKWAPAREVYKANFDHPARDIDLADVVTAVSGVKKERPDIIIGGPPCQDYSAAGMRIESDRAGLTVSFAEIVYAARPTWFVMENVREARKSVSWLTARRLLTRAGYGISEHVLNAAHFGVPQNRKRFFAVGRLGEDHQFLEDALEEGASEMPMSVREYLGEELGIEFYYRHPRNWGRRAVYSIDEPSATIRTTNRPVPPGYSRHPNDAADFRLARALTPGERARIQTFSPQFSFAGTSSQRDIMVANAVPVELARHVAGTIKRFEEERGVISADRTFRAWLLETRHYTPRTAGNVVSRLNRAAKLLKKSRLEGEALLLVHQLERNREYQGLTSSVRSQVKQAIKLHAEFREARS